MAYDNYGNWNSPLVKFAVVPKMGLGGLLGGGSAISGEEEKDPDNPDMPMGKETWDDYMARVVAPKMKNAGDDAPSVQKRYKTIWDEYQKK